MRNVIVGAIVLFFVGTFFAIAQDQLPATVTIDMESAVLVPATDALSPLIGKWIGTWEAAGRSQAHGQMEVELQVNDGDRITGRVRVTHVSAASCSNVWESLVGMKKGEKLSLQYYLGVPCGNVVVDLVIDPKKNNLLLGTYVSEFPGKGTVRLKKQ